MVFFIPWKSHPPQEEPIGCPTKKCISHLQRLSYTYTTSQTYKRSMQFNWPVDRYKMLWLYSPKHQKMWKTTFVVGLQKALCPAMQLLQFIALVILMNVDLKLYQNALIWYTTCFSFHCSATFTAYLLYHKTRNDKLKTFFLWMQDFIFLTTQQSHCSLFGECWYLLSSHKLACARYMLIPLLIATYLDNNTRVRGLTYHSLNLHFNYDVQYTHNID